MINELISKYKDFENHAQLLPNYIRNMNVPQQVIYQELELSRSTFSRLMRNPENFTTDQLQVLSELENKYV